MSSKLLKKELHRVIRQSIDKQQEGSGGKGKQQGKRAAKRAKRQQARPSAEERLAANLKYFARTTTTRGPAADFVAQALAKQGFQPRPKPAQQPAQQQQQQQGAREDWEDDADEFLDLI